MATLRELKGRIGSVASSEKITGAMKMISSAKMHKAEQSLRKLVPFRTQIADILAELLTSDAEFSSPLTQERREVASKVILILGSDDGLCGAYNVNLYKLLIERLGNLRAEEAAAGMRPAEVKIVAVGAKMLKAVSHLRMTGVTVEAAPEGVNSKSEGQTVRAYLKELIDNFTAGRFDTLDVMYMHFLSISRQRPAFERMLPLTPDKLATDSASEATVNTNRPCLFEPSADDIFQAVVPMFLLSMLQEIFIENRASEQAARVMAMQSANDNAKKLLEQLRLEYNKLRQQSITNELLDIVGGQIR